MASEEASKSPEAQPQQGSLQGPRERRARRSGRGRRGRGRRPQDRPEQSESQAPAAEQQESRLAEGVPQTEAPTEHELIAASTETDEREVIQEIAPSPPVEEIARTDEPLSDSQESSGSPEPEVRPEPAPVRQPHYEARRSAPPPERAREFRPAEPSAVAKAIEEVNEIVDSLRSALDEMEDVLESLEAVERQKEADEHEIESLRRSLRQLHRPRDSSQRR